MILNNYAREDFYQYSIPIESGRHTLAKLVGNVRLIMVVNSILVLCLNGLISDVEVYNSFLVKTFGNIMLFLSLLSVLVTFIKGSNFKELYVAFLFGASSFLLGVLMILVCTFHSIEENSVAGKVVDANQVNRLLLIILVAVAIVFLVGRYNLVKKVKNGQARKNSKSSRFYEDGEVNYQHVSKKMVPIVLAVVVLNYGLRLFSDDLRDMYYHAVIYSGALLVIYLAPRNFMTFYLKKDFQ